MNEIYNAMLFTEKQYKEMYWIAKYSRSVTYKARLNQIEKRLAFLYLIVNNHFKGTIKISSQL